jgi:hypothetical protein
LLLTEIKGKPVHAGILAVRVQPCGYFYMPANISLFRINPNKINIDLNKVQITLAGRRYRYDR